MSEPASDEPPIRARAIARWDDEGGAEPDGPQHLAPENELLGPATSPTPAEWAELRTRVIALENLVIALLATASEAQRDLARKMADFIAPRPGSTPHRLTVHAAHRMSDLVDRAARFDRGDA
ncbi:MAG: hypothetical protein ABI376_11110 [Caulobacteraceae bacterium]